VITIIKKENTNSRHPSFESNDNNTSAILENHVHSLNNITVEEQGNHNENNPMKEDELEE